MSFDFLKEIAKQNKISFKIIDEQIFEFTDRHSSRKIAVKFYDKDARFEVYFAGIKRSFSDSDEVASFVNSILLDEVVAFELSNNGQTVLSRNMKTEKLFAISLAEASALFGFDASVVEGYRFKTVSWSSELDGNGKLTVDHNLVRFLKKIGDKPPKRSFKSTLKKDRQYLNPLRFRMNHIIMPCYLTVITIFIVVFGTLMALDAKKYFPVGIGFMVAFAAVSIAMLILSNITIKKEIEYELEKYDFDTSKIAVPEYYEYETEYGTVTFDKDGMFFSEKAYGYHQIKVMFAARCPYQHIVLELVFTTSDKMIFTLPVTSKTLKMLDNYKFNMPNKGTLDELVDNPKKAFKYIYRNGKI